MAKRRLNKQQRARVERQQLAARDSTDQQRGLVIANFGKQAAVEGADDPTVQRCDVRPNIDSLVAGDRVSWQKKAGGGLVTSLLPRRNQLARPNSRGQLKPVAANIDHAVLVIATRPLAFSNLIDRYLAAIELSNIQPLLLLNKVDLLDTGADQALIVMLAHYERMGYTVLRVAAATETGIGALRSALSNGNSVFVGQSGVGKSSLINCLCPAANTQVGELSGGAIKGKHTTTTARLFHLPGGGSIIDSPGIREFHLWHVDERELINGFIDIRPFANDCQFRNCAHQTEKNCAVRKAYQRGAISESRWQNYWRIRTTLQKT